MHERRSVVELAQVHLPLERRAAATYALGRGADFAATLATFLAFGVTRAVDFGASRTLLAFDLGYALSLGRPTEAHAGARALLQTPANDALAPRGDPLALQGAVLAQLLGREPEAAARSARALDQAIDLTRRGRAERAALQAFVRIAAALAAGQPPDVDACVAGLDALVRQRLDAQLQRWAAGGSIEALSEQLWDWPLTALLALVSDAGMHAGAPVACADFRWTRAAP